jgi:hypothetical protein
MVQNLKRITSTEKDSLRELEGISVELKCGTVTLADMERHEFAVEDIPHGIF